MDNLGTATASGTVKPGRQVAAGWRAGLDLPAAHREAHIIRIPAPDRADPADRDLGDRLEGLAVIRGTFLRNEAVEEVAGAVIGDENDECSTYKFHF